MLKSNFKIISIVLLLVLGLSLVAFLQLQKPLKDSPELVAELAKCVKDKAKDEAYFKWGIDFGSGKENLLIFSDGWECKSGVQLYKDENKLLVSKELKTLDLYSNKFFRQGVYEQAAGPLASLKQKQVFGELGLWLENSVSVRNNAFNCGVAEPEAIAFVSQLDFPFLMAVIGVKADIGDTDTVQRIAAKLIDLNLVFAQIHTLEDCSKVKKQDFLDYATKMHAFYKGEHPWVKGCGIQADESGLALKCIGQKLN